MNVVHAFVLAAAGVLPTEAAVVEKVDLIEVNHFYDEQGRPVFDQCVFYDWTQERERYDVLAWRLIKTGDQYPQRNWGKGGYTAIWYDGEVLRHVNAAAFRETDTQHDVELVEREWMPKDMRRELLPMPPRFKPKLRKFPATQ
jgi:hypothetical protein